MSESITAEDKEQNPQKPPSSVGRIACDIVAGTAARFAIAVPVLYVTVYVVVCAIWGQAKNLSLRGLLAAVFNLLAFPMFYGPASSVADFPVGRRAHGTGLLLATLGIGLRGLSVVALL